MSMGEGKAIVLADDHVMFRQSMAALLERSGYCVVGQAANGLDAVEEVNRHRPDLAVLDFGMPGMNGIESARAILSQAPDTMVLLVTMQEDDENVLAALRAGVRGYILKAQASVDLLNAVAAILQGSIYLSPQISETVVNAYKAQRYDSEDVLSVRERQILQLIVEGHTTKEAASMLSVSPKTAEAHRAHIMQKLDIHGVAGLVRYAFRKGILTRD